MPGADLGGELGRHIHTFPRRMCDLGLSARHAPVCWGDTQHWEACVTPALQSGGPLPASGALSMADTSRISKTCLPGAFYLIPYLFFQQTTRKQDLQGPGFPAFLTVGDEERSVMFLLQGPVSAGSDLDFFDTHLKIHAGPPACSPYPAGNTECAPPHGALQSHSWASEQRAELSSPMLSQKAVKNAARSSSGHLKNPSPPAALTPFLPRWGCSSNY